MEVTVLIETAKAHRADEVFSHGASASPLTHEDSLAMDGVRSRGDRQEEILHQVNAGIEALYYDLIVERSWAICGTTKDSPETARIADQQSQQRPVQISVHVAGQ